MSSSDFRRRAPGFAYIWTLMLVAFMGVGLVLASELHATAARRDKERELLFIGHEFRNALGRYYDSTPGDGRPRYPLTLQELLRDPRFANARRHLRRLYADPVTGKAEWGLLRQEGRIVGIHSLSPQLPIKQDNFLDEDASLRRKQRYTDWHFTYPHDLVLAPPDAAGGAPGLKPKGAN
ncbi:type II secretion system protein [Janthinobacterium sp. BJB401]|uniref:type II secretion system protein n=1 Tax=Janthinobacterium sp. BJB401 TaxID=2745934 RepID=UPI0020CF8F0B|nr:type II secretion system protein [Janthinobacterium sp. BJB401]